MKKNIIVEAAGKLIRALEQVTNYFVANTESMEARLPMSVPQGEKWLSGLKEKGVQLSLVDYFSLRAGHAIFTRIGAEQRDGWVTMAKGGDGQLKVMPSHYNYDVKAVLAQLPLGIKNQADLSKAADTLKRGQYIDTDIRMGAGTIPVRITADPLHRAVSIRNSLGNPVSLKELDIRLTPPAEIQHYRLCEGDKVLFAGKDYQEVARELQSYALNAAGKGEASRYHVVAMTDTRLPDFDATGKLVSDHQLVMSAVSYGMGTGEFSVQAHIPQGDIMTALEKEMRLMTKEKPFLTDREVRVVYEQKKQKQDMPVLKLLPKLLPTLKQQHRMHH